MLAPGALARAASLTPASGWLHPCARTRLLRAQLDAPDDGLDDGFLDDGLDADFLDDGLDADYLDRQLSFASQGRIRNRRSSIFDRRFSLDEIRPPRRNGSPNPFSELTYEETRLRRLPSTLGRVYSEVLSRPGQQLVLGALFLLIGFYLAGSLSTIFGAAAFWEPVIALVPLFLTETISREYYSRAPSERSVTLKLFNAAKVGFYFGVAIDALKLAG